MAITVEELLVRIAADTADLENGLRRAESTTKSMAARLSKLGDSMAAVGRKMTVGLTLPIVGFGVKAVAAFDEAQKAANQTAAVLKSTGGAANVTAAGIDKLAQALSRKAAIDDETIQQGANMLLTFTNVRNEAGKGNDIFNRSVKVMTDVAAAMAAASGGELDLKSTAIQLGKALNDPVKGITALTRVGVAFTAEQKDQIKTLVKAGDILGAQKIILAELTKEFGGSAKANATDSMRMKVAFDNLAESVGSILSPVVQKLSAWVSRLTAAFQSLTPETQATIVKVLAVVAAVGPALIVFGKLLQLVKLVQGAFLLLSANPVILILAAIAAIALLIIKNWDAVKAWFLALPGIISGVFAQIRDAIVNAFKAAINAIIGLWNRLDTNYTFTFLGKKVTTPDIFPDIPMLAKGGIVTAPTLAMVGERGPEAVVPLSGGSSRGLSVIVTMDRKTFPRQQEYLLRASGL